MKQKEKTKKVIKNVEIDNYQIMTRSKIQNAINDMEKEGYQIIGKGKTKRTSNDRENEGNEENEENEIMKRRKIKKNDKENERYQIMTRGQTKRASNDIEKEGYQIMTRGQTKGASYDIKKNKNQIIARSKMQNVSYDLEKESSQIMTRGEIKKASINIENEKNEIITRKIKKDGNKKEVEIKIRNKKISFYSIEDRLLEAEQKFQEFKNNKDEKKKFKIITEIIEVCEINSNFNYNYLILCQKLNKKKFKDEIINLCDTLSNEDYSNLFNNKPKSPSMEIYDIILSFIHNQQKFLEKIQNINIVEYNLPLVKGSERLRVNYYKQYFRNPTDRLKEGINNCSRIIYSMRNFFENIKLDTNDFDSQLYLFILYLQDIICDSTKDSLILNYYSDKFCNNKKNTDYDFFKIENNKLYIYNEYEKIKINIKDYVPENIYIEAKYHKSNLPLEILLQRNISFDYFNNHKKTINCINDNELYKDFKEYFKLFINSKLIKDALDKFDPNLKNLIESNIFKGNELDEEFVKTLPIISEKIQGITNKDLAISFISSSPFILDNWAFPKNLDEYRTIKKPKEPNI